ncbi:MAG TPA: M1 family metallopeptidase, partial [Gemmatimonadaceae bacterium]|nr:M1 family metallopeptidase [Gemmatimonadaceae bacterium]
MIQFLALALLQQAAFQGATTPASGDTIGYWQQRVAYTVVATLDEDRSVLHSRATLVYVNNSPDTLREMYFHQYLNAFRPGSKWSAADEREHRLRFQDLRDPDYGYERFTAAPTVNGSPIVVDYPGAPDSTVAHFRLPAPLAPHDSVRITLVWDARPSTVTRRQGRRGRTYDFAQWFPKVAVYDRRGWEPNALVPAGELYGEYGTYDVTMVVRNDQIIASTGVPVSGDPGWARVSRTGPPYLGSTAYVSLQPAPPVDVPSGSRAVRFVARDVHHFAWSASPDYLYEGGTYVRQLPKTHFQTWDTIGVHVLYKPGDDTTWGGGRAVDRTIFALKWLESIWGPYAYPAFTNVHRLDPGGTEFPMMIMDGGASQGLILHEAGHNFTYGILGNNEWRSGWMDEGFTDYQTDWAENLTPQERIGRVQEPARLSGGYRVNGVRMSHADSVYLAEWQLEIEDRTQPIGTNSAEFREFGIYNSMIYNRAKLMYGQLRDVMGDTAFRAFLHDYYNTWALKHVDELAMRSAAERAYGHPLGWFFDEWIRGTGLMDYALDGATVQTDGTRFETIARISRRGELRHRMPVGVRTASGWTIARADPLVDEQDVHIIT